jgi:hypothetical protein
LKAGVGESEDIRVSQFNEAGVVIEQGQEAIFAFIVFGGADVEAGVEGGNFSGEFAITAIDSVVGLVVVAAFLVGWVVVGNGITAGTVKVFPSRWMSSRGKRIEGFEVEEREEFERRRTLMVDMTEGQTEERRRAKSGGERSRNNENKVRAG